MKRTLYSMVLCNDSEEHSLPCSVAISGYCAHRHHEVIRSVYARSFAESPWPPDWDKFEEFDPDGAFVAEAPGTAEVVGYVLSFRRRDFGYISVLAVVPEHRRKGVGLALVRSAIRYLRGLNVRPIRVDAYTDATPAVNLYRKAGFEVETTFEDEEE